MVAIVVFAIAYLQFANAKNDDGSFPLTVPQTPATRQIFKAYQHLPKPQNLQEESTNVIAALNDVATENAKTSPSKECIPDVSQHCPEGWELVGEDCHAASTYKGDCATIINFENYTIQGKIDWANSCNVAWPCKAAGTGDGTQYSCPDYMRNYLQPCPQLFLKHSSGDGSKTICVPDFSSYTGPCNAEMDFGNFTREEKKTWAQSCATDWPCLTQCPSVFDQCPLDWTQNANGSCSAPESYKGPCDKNIYFTYFTQEMKLDYATNCGIAFECSAKCKRSYAQCPVYWKRLGNGQCLAPRGLQECPSLQDKGNASGGGRTLNLSKYTVEDLILIEAQCPWINWPCETDDGINWDAPCPLDWTQEQDGGYRCLPPTTKQGDVCHLPTAFTSVHEKRHWASYCQNPWPPMPVLVHQEAAQGQTFKSQQQFPSGPVDSHTGHVLVSNNKNRQSANIKGTQDKHENQQSQKQREYCNKTSNNGLIDSLGNIKRVHKHQMQNASSGFTSDAYLSPPLYN